MNVRLGACILSTLVPLCIGAQGPVTVAAGTVSSVQVAAGAKLAVPVILEFPAPSQGTTVGSLSLTVSWSAAQLVFDSAKAGPFGVASVNSANAASGSVTLNAASLTGVGVTTTAATLFFTATGAGGTRVLLAADAVSNTLGSSVLANTGTRNLDVCVSAQGQWGEVTGDNVVNIVDAQQIARWSVGLSVANAAAVQGNGDVTADAQVNIIDAQQIARFSVSLPAAARINTSQATPLSVGSVTLTPGAVTMATGETMLIVGSANDASGLPLLGCASISWTSSNAAIAAVDQGGLVTAIGTGVVSITAASAGQFVQRAITVSPAPPALSVVIGPGVTGTPVSGTSLFALGSLVPYTFATSPGFQNLQVRIDGADAMATGSLSMNGPHSIVALADSTITLLPVTAALVTPVRALLNDPGPRAAMATIAASFDELYRTVPAAEAAGQLRALMAAAFDPVADGAAMRLLAQRLGAPSTTGALNSRARVTPRIQSVVSAANRGVTLLFVNGIFAAPPEVDITTSAIREVIAPAAGFVPASMGGHDAVGKFYNATWTFDPNYPAMECAGWLSKVLNSPHFLITLATMNECTQLHDLSVALTQLLTVTRAFPAGSTQKSAELADSIRSVIRSGNSVILLGHSQGSLLVEEALQNLYTNLTPDARATAAACIGVVAVGAPTSNGYSVGGEIVDGLTIKGLILGDIILALGQNGFPSMSTNVSEAVEGAVALAALTGPGMAPLNAIAGSLHLHSMDASYLGGTESAQWLKERLHAQREQLRATCGDRMEVVPPSAIIENGTVLPLAVKVTNPLGESVAVDPASWAASAGNVVSVSQSGAVTGVNVGGPATVTATINGVTASSTLTVVTPLGSTGGHVVPIGVSSSWETSVGSDFQEGSTTAGPSSSASLTKTASGGGVFANVPSAPFFATAHYTVTSSFDMAISGGPASLSVSGSASSDMSLQVSPFDGACCFFEHPDGTGKGSSGGSVTYTFDVVDHPVSVAINLDCTIATKILTGQSTGSIRQVVRAAVSLFGSGGPGSTIGGTFDCSSGRPPNTVNAWTGTLAPGHYTVGIGASAHALVTNEFVPFGCCAFPYDLHSGTGWARLTYRMQFIVK